MLVPSIDAVMLALPAVWAPQHTKALLASAALSLVLLTNGRGYRPRLHLSVLDELPWLVGRIMIATAVVATVTALRHAKEEVVASFLVVALGALCLVVAGRIVTTQVMLFGRRHRLVSNKTVLVGGGPLASELAVILGRYPQYGLSVVGFVSDSHVDAATNTEWLGSVAHLERIVRERQIRVILVADAGGAEESLLDMINMQGVGSCDLLVVPRLHQLHTQVGLPDHIGSIPIMRINSPSLDGMAWTAKRGFDILISLVALVLLFPLLIICALAVRIEGGPGVLFRQERVGRNGEIFSCLKLRSMKPVDTAESATRWSIATDSRVGSFGRFLRRTGIDELPQLWNILRGDMTLVGPRPERPHFVDKFTAEIPRYHHRHRVRAGLTGFAQVSGLRGDTPITDRARFDNYYIENWSLWMDAKILLRTFAEVFRAKGE